MDAWSLIFVLKTKTFFETLDYPVGFWWTLSLCRKFVRNILKSKAPPYAQISHFPSHWKCMEQKQSVKCGSPHFYSCRYGFYLIPSSIDVK